MHDGHVAALLNRAVSSQRAGADDEALALYQQIIERDPMNPSAYSNMALILKKTGNYTRAAECLQKAIVGHPHVPAAYNNLGNLLREHGNRERAPVQNKRCVVLSPLYSEGYNNLGMSMPDSDGAERLVAYRKSLILMPNYADAWLNLANLAGYERKIPTDPTPGHFYRRCLLIRPNYSTAISSYGVYRASVGELSAAIEQQEHAIRLNPEYREAYFNLALYYLLSGRFHEGFSLYEHGIGGRSADRMRGSKRRVAQPQWKGERLAGKSILVTAEQGVGDEIMFAGLLPELYARARKVYLETTPRLTPIMTRSFPQIEVFSYNPECPSPNLSNGTIDYSLPIGSLPLFFRKSLLDFGRQRPYAVPNPSLARHFRMKYRAMFPGKILVGFSWRGGSGHLRSKSRSLDQSTFQSLLDVPSLQGISLQYGIKADERKWFADNNSGNIYYDGTVEPIESMDVAFAQIAAMDIVVSVTNAAVHSAGALGVPCWILVPHISDWRWTWGRHDVVWYPGMRSFRQETVGEWEAPLARLKRDLVSYVEGCGQLRANPAPEMDWRGEM